MLAWSLWGLLGCAVIVGLYVYRNVDEGIRSHVEDMLARQYPDLQVTVRSARLLELEGIEIHGISMARADSQNAIQPIAVADEVLVRCNPKLNGIMQGQVEVREIVARRVAVRCSRSPQGHWSIQPLFKLPTLGGQSLPTIRLENSVLEVVDNTQIPPSRLTLRDINAVIQPEYRGGSKAATRLKIIATLTGDHLNHTVLHGYVNPQDGTWVVEGKDVQVDVSRAFYNALPANVTEKIGQLDGLSARVRGAFQVAGNPQRTPSIRVNAYGQILDGRVDDPRFTYPFTDLVAEFEVNDNVPNVRQFQARYGNASIDCSVEYLASGKESPMVVDGNVSNLRIDGPLISRMPESVQAQWQRFQPTGEVNAEFHLEIQNGVIRSSAEIECQDLALQWEGFPYPVAHSQGRVSIRPGQLAFELRGIAASVAPVFLRGHVYSPGPKWHGWFETNSQGAIPIDETLLAACSPKMQAIVRPFQARGDLSIATKIERATPDAPLVKSGAIELHDCSIRHKLFPYPLHSVRGTLVMLGDDWTFKNVEGRNDNAVVECHGSWDSQRDGGRLDLEFVASKLPLEDELRDALSPGARKIWQLMRPQGAIDQVKAKFEMAKRIGHERLTVSLQQQRGVGRRTVSSLSVTPSSFPYRIEHLTGSATLDNGIIRLHQLRGRHGQVEIFTNGSAQVFEDGSWQVRFADFAADHFQIDQEFLNVAPPRLATAFRNVELAGPISVLGSLTLSANAHTNYLLSTEWNLDVDLEGGSVGKSTRLQNISGGVQLTGKATIDDVVCHGELNIDSLTYQDIQLTQLRGPFHFDGHQVAFGTGATQPGQPQRHAVAKLFDGDLAFDSVMSMDESGEFRTTAQLANADLPFSLRELGYLNGADRGNVDLRFSLQGNNSGSHSWDGAGEMRVRDTNLYELPVVLAVIQTMRTGSDDRSAFSSAEIRFRLKGRHTYLDQLDLIGDTLTLKGIGEINRKRELNVNFYTVIGRETSYLAAVRPLLGLASRKFMVVKIRGPVDQMEMTREVLPGLNETLQQWFPETANPSGSLAGQTGTMDHWNRQRSPTIVPPTPGQTGVLPAGYAVPPTHP